MFDMVVTSGVFFQSGFPGMDGEDKFSNGFPESILTDKLRDRIQVLSISFSVFQSFNNGVLNSLIQ